MAGHGHEDPTERVYFDKEPDRILYNTGKPLWVHNCGACEFLGTIMSRTGTLLDGQFDYEVFDLYVCGDRTRFVRLKSRYGQNPAQVTEVGYASVETLKGIAGDVQFPLNVAAQIVLETARLTERRLNQPRCEVCKAQVREGLRFCSGLKGCFTTFLLTEAGDR